MNDSFNIIDNFNSCTLQNAQEYCENFEIKERFTSALKIQTSKWIPNDSPLAAFKELAECNVNETAIRTLIDSILLPILEVCNLKVNYEETIKFDDLPTCRLDYIIKTKESQAIGVIEAKKLGAMTEKSLVQAMLQLVCLQKRGNCASTIFAIVTDAMHYHFMALSDDTFVIESITTAQPVFPLAQFAYTTPHIAFQPAQPVIIPAQPVFQPSPPVFTSAQPVFTPAQPVFQPFPPVFTPAQPAIPPAQPVFTPAQHVITPVIKTVKSWEDFHDVTYSICKLFEAGKMILQNQKEN